VAQEKRKQDEQNLTIHRLVERETALNQAEREQYAKFLEKEFFTKSDFGKLREFYAHTWDRLTEAGKDLMTMRVFEGVRRKEFEFSELPDEVKEKEAGRLHELILRGRRSPAELGGISPQDREAFIDAQNRGDKRNAYAALDHAFDESVTHSSKKVHSEAAVGKDVSVATPIKNSEAQSASKPASSASELMGTLEFDPNELPEVPTQSVKAPAACAVAQAPKAR
jgi:hypothetical protein